MERDGPRIARWILDHPVGGGTSAQLFRARDPADGTEVELELLPPGGSPGRFAEVLRCQSRVRHPNVVRAYEEVVTDTVRAIALQAVDGPTLAELIPRASFTATQLEALTSGIIAGLSAIHAAGVVHRDLRPENIRVQRNGEVLVPLITGFGCARLLNGAAPPSDGTLIGVPGTLAPEQLRDPSRAGVAADVFSLGATLYAVVCGLPPFVGEPAEIFDAIAAERYLLPSRLADVTATAEAAIIGALHPDPARRVPDVDSFGRVWRGVPTRTGWVPLMIPPTTRMPSGENDWERLAERTLVPEPNPWARTGQTAGGANDGTERTGGMPAASLLVPAVVLFLAGLGALAMRVGDVVPPDPPTSE